MKLKILLMGIAKAGKTSILLKLDNKTEELGSVKPTQGVNYNEIHWAGFEIACWDVAGQEVYQKKFLLEHDRNFAGVSAIIYVISTEEEETFKDAINLLKNTVDIVDKMKLVVPFTFCLHKLDPIRREMDTFRKREKDLRNKIAKAMGKHPYEIFITRRYASNLIVR